MLPNTKLLGLYVVAGLLNMSSALVEAYLHTILVFVPHYALVLIHISTSLDVTTYPAINTATEGIAILLKIRNSTFSTYLVEAVSIP